MEWFGNGIFYKILLHLRAFSFGDGGDASPSGLKKAPPPPESPMQFLHCIIVSSDDSCRIVVEKMIDIFLSDMMQMQSRCRVRISQLSQHHLRLHQPFYTLLFIYLFILYCLLKFVSNDCFTFIMLKDVTPKNFLFSLFSYF